MQHAPPLVPHVQHTAASDHTFRSQSLRSRQVVISAFSAGGRELFMDHSMIGKKGNSKEKKGKKK